MTDKHHRDGPVLSQLLGAAVQTPEQEMLMDVARRNYGLRSSSEPNLQNLVQRTELGTLIKESFQPDLPQSSTSGRQPRVTFLEMAECIVEAVNALPPLAWVPVTTATPKHNRKRGSTGTQVLIWPHAGDTAVAYYGRRVTDEPNFYLYGAVLHGVTHWMPLPEGPK